MDFKDLSYVIAIAKHHNITKAADSLYLSQPTLTKFLQKLEKDLNLKLFKKLGNKYVLTYAGERYVDSATDILNKKKSLDAEMNDIIKNNVGILKIAYPMMRSIYAIPGTVPAFNKVFPNVVVDLKEADSLILEDYLLQGKTDLAFFNLPIINPNLDYQLISHEEIVLIVSANHPLAKSGTQKKGLKHPWIDLQKFKTEDFIMQTHSQRTWQSVKTILHDNNMTPNIKLTTSNISAAVELVADGYGAYFITASHLKHLRPSKKIACFSIGEMAYPIDFVVAYRKGSYLSYYEKEYINIVKKFF